MEKRKNLSRKFVYWFCYFKVSRNKSNLAFNGRTNTAPNNKKRIASIKSQMNPNDKRKDRNIALNMHRLPLYTWLNRTDLVAVAWLCVNGIKFLMISLDLFIRYFYWTNEAQSKCNQFYSMIPMNSLLTSSSSSIITFQSV